MDKELKPCPFCGGEAKIADGVKCFGHGDFDKLYAVMCSNCGATSGEYYNCLKGERGMAGGMYWRKK